jgi:hypothetical protein
MLWTVDLTLGSNLSSWEDFDFCDATLLFEPPRQLGRELVLPVWGATIVSAGEFVAGYGVLELRGVRSGSLDLWLYENGNRGFHLNEQGLAQLVVREWLPAMGDGRKMPEYGLECVIARLRGFGVLRLRAAGRVYFRYDDRDVVSARAYAMHPERFAWPGYPG